MCECFLLRLSNKPLEAVKMFRFLTFGVVSGRKLNLLWVPLVKLPNTFLNIGKNKKVGSG